VGLKAKLGLIILLSCICGVASARDPEGKYANSPLHDWFNHLASGKGLCCSLSDGYVVEDADWDSKDGHYRVRIPTTMNGTETEWVDVPEDAVITEPNKMGRTMVWPIYGYMGRSIRCFMPGPMG
jgi:hypothetical protein